MRKTLTLLSLFSLPLCGLWGQSLAFFVQAGDYEKVREILSDGTNPDVWVTLGQYEEMNVLMMASDMGYVRIAQELLRNGADPNLETAHGSTALMMATLRGHYQLCALLIQHGAYWDTKTPSGATALEVAIGQGYWDIADLLRAAGASLEYR